MILKSDSTKIVQGAMFLEKLSTMKWGQLVLHIHIENLKKKILLKTNCQISK